MKQGDKALNASSLQFLSIVKGFIASSLRFFSALNASSLLIFMGKHSLTLHRHYFLKEIHLLMLHRRYFLKKLCPPLAGSTREYRGGRSSPNEGWLATDKGGHNSVEFRNSLYGIPHFSALQWYMNMYSNNTL